MASALSSQLTRTQSRAKGIRVVGDINEKTKISQTVAFQVIGWITAILLTYGAMNARVSVLEDRVDRLASDVQEIKQDVKTLLRRP